MTSPLSLDILRIPQPCCRSCAAAGPAATTSRRHPSQPRSCKRFCRPHRALSHPPRILQGTCYITVTKAIPQLLDAALSSLGKVGRAQLQTATAPDEIRRANNFIAWAKQRKTDQTFDPLFFHAPLLLMFVCKSGDPRDAAGAAAYTELMAAQLVLAASTAATLPPVRPEARSSGHCWGLHQTSRCPLPCAGPPGCEIPAYSAPSEHLPDRALRVNFIIPEAVPDPDLHKHRLCGSTRWSRPVPRSLVLPQ